MAEVRVLLASASPRRLDLLRRLGVEPSVQVTDVDETPRAGEEPAALVARLAAAKAAVVPGDAGTLVVAADTVISLDGQAVGKPRDHDAAVMMLTRLSGRSHEVLTGICLARGERVLTAVDRTAVHFRDLDEAEIRRYVARGGSDGRAGAYGIQDEAEAFVDRIEGSHSGVVGLPLARVVTMARSLGVVLPAPAG